MKTNVKYLNSWYNVNSNKGTVFCKLTFGIDLDKITSIDLVRNSPKYHKLINDLTNPYTGIATLEYQNQDNDDFCCSEMLVFKTYGIAYCSGEDKFNESFGKKLANTRAQRESFKIAKEFYDSLFEILMTEVHNIVRLSMNCDSVAYKCKGHELNLR